MSFIAQGTGLVVDFPRTGEVFSNLSFTINRDEKIGLVGRNGSGKSTLCRLILGELTPDQGRLARTGSVAYVSQFRPSLEANDALSHGEERMRRLSHAFSSGAELLILDEPSNHLDRFARRWLLEEIRCFQGALLIVSHDRECLRLVDAIWLLDHGLRVYGGNFDFYQAARSIETESFERQFHSSAALHKRVVKERQKVLERQAKRESRGKARRDKLGLPKIILNSMAENAQGTSARLKSRHERRAADAKARALAAKSRLPTEFELRFDPIFNELSSHRILVQVRELILGYEKPLWRKPVSFELRARERLRLEGANGSGKSSLLHAIHGPKGESVLPQIVSGHLSGDLSRVFWLPQEAAVPVDGHLTLVDAAMELAGTYDPTKVRTVLARAGFPQDRMLKPVCALSGGERVRLWLATWFIGEPPEWLILDEPENNLDLETLALLEEVLRNAPIAILLVTHDDEFARRIGIEGVLQIE